MGLQAPSRLVVLIVQHPKPLVNKTVIPNTYRYKQLCIVADVCDKVYCIVLLAD